MRPSGAPGPERTPRPPADLVTLGSFSRFALVLGVLLAAVAAAHAMPSFTAHRHTATSVSWSIDGVIPPANPQRTAHQHRSPRSFRGYEDLGQPYSAASVWDDWVYHLHERNPFRQGHGHIAESDPSRVPTYFFDGVWPPVDASGHDPRSLVRRALAEWSAIASDRADIETGIEFREGSANAEILVRWTDLPDDQGGGVWQPTYCELWFDSSYAWSFEVDPREGEATGIRPDQWHFFSVALHETGHLVGLEHQRDSGDLMTSPVGQPPDVPGHRYFTRITADAVEGVRDLYSIPKAAAPATATPPDEPTPPRPPTEATPVPPPKGPGCCRRDGEAPGRAQRGGAFLPFAILFAWIGLRGRSRLRRPA